MPESPPTETQPDLRKVFLETTRKMLVDQGYTSLSMRKIASKAGYSATSIYLYFSGKDALFDALVDEGMADLYKTLKSIVDQHSDDPVYCLHQICHAYILFGLENREYYEIMFMLHPVRSAPFPVAVYRRGRRNLRLVASVVEEGIRKGIYKIPKASAFVTCLWASLHGAVSLMIADRLDRSIDREDFRNLVVTSALLGLEGS